MDHKIKPTATRIGISTTWSTISYYNSLLEDKFINLIIKKILLKFKILTSEISIKKLSDFYIIVFCYYPLKSSSNKYFKPPFSLQHRALFRLFSFIKGILEQSLGKRIYFKAVQVPSFVTNAEILASWIQLELIKKPKLHKTIVFKVLKEWNLNILRHSYSNNK